MKAIPLRGRVLVEVMTDMDKTKGGIVIPDVAKNRSMVKVKVIAVGPPRTTESGFTIQTQAKEGDILLIMPNTAFPVEIDQASYLVCREEDLYIRLDY